MYSAYFGVAVMSLVYTRIREVIGSNISPNIAYPQFVRVSFSPSRKGRDKI